MKILYTIEEIIHSAMNEKFKVFSLHTFLAVALEPLDTVSNQLWIGKLGKTVGTAASDIKIYLINIFDIFILCNICESLSFKKHGFVKCLITLLSSFLSVLSAAIVVTEVCYQVENNKQLIFRAVS